MLVLLATSTSSTRSILGEDLELAIAELGAVRLGEGCVCNNPGENGLTPCGMLFRDHPREGNKVNSNFKPFFRNLTVLIA